MKAPAKLTTRGQEMGSKDGRKQFKLRREDEETMAGYCTRTASVANTIWRNYFRKYVEGYGMGVIEDFCVMEDHESFEYDGKLK